VGIELSILYAEATPHLQSESSTGKSSTVTHYVSLVNGLNDRCSL
jgi:hypothetical protein